MKFIFFFSQPERELSPPTGTMSCHHWSDIDLLPHSNDASDGLPFQHVIKSLVNLREWNCVSDEFLQFQFLHTRPHYQLRYQYQYEQEL